jgi:hypothetical protein
MCSMICPASEGVHHAPLGAAAALHQHGAWPMAQAIIYACNKLRSFVTVLPGGPGQLLVGQPSRWLEQVLGV